MKTSRPPRAIQKAMRQMGDNLRLWRKLNRTSLELLSKRSGVSVSTIQRLEAGSTVSTENLLRIARCVPPMLESIIAATDPYETDRGRALATSILLKEPSRDTPADSNRFADPASSIQLGRHEDTDEPVYLDPLSTQPKPRVMVGGRGSGREGLEYLAIWRYSTNDVPQVVISTKPEYALRRKSDIGVQTFDDLRVQDGPLDPIRCRLPHAEQRAADLLVSLNPWGSDPDQYIPLLPPALRYGMNQGARCIGHALNIAMNDGHINAHIVEPTLAIRNRMSMAAAFIGLSSEASTFSLDETVTTTVICSNGEELDLPRSHPVLDLDERLRLAFYNALTMVTIHAMRRQQTPAILHLLDTPLLTPSDVASLSTMAAQARMADVTLNLTGESVSALDDNGLADLTNSGVALHLADDAEARAACRVLGLDDDSRRRILAGQTLPDGGANPESLMALRDSLRGFLRPVVGLLSRPDHDTEPTIIDMPFELMELFSENPLGVRR